MQKYRDELSEEALQPITQALQEHIEREEVAGIVAAIYNKTFGWQDKEGRLPMRPDTIFQIASMTKPITAVATMMLVEEGRLRLDDPIDNWLPELANRKVMRDPNGSLDDVYPAPRPITLHDLLTYRLGLGWGQHQLQPLLDDLMMPPFGQNQQKPPKVQLDPDTWLTRLGELPLVYPPGERWLYHIASEIMAVLVSRVAGMPFDKFLQQRIFEPLGMLDTAFNVPLEKQSRFAVLYTRSSSGGLEIVEHPRSNIWTNPPLFPSGAAGLVATVADYQRFGQMLLNKGELNGVRILTPATVEAMTSDYLTPEQHAQPFFSWTELWADQGFGYGLAVKTKPTNPSPNPGAFYWPGAYGTLWLADPQADLLAILLIQLSGPNPFHTSLGDNFLTLLYQTLSQIA